MGAARIGSSFQRASTPPWGVWLSKTAAAAVTLAASMLIAGKIQNGGFTHEQE